MLAPKPFNLVLSSDLDFTSSKQGPVLVALATSHLIAGIKGLA